MRGLILREGLITLKFVGAWKMLSLTLLLCALSSCVFIVREADKYLVQHIRQSWIGKLKNSIRLSEEKKVPHVRQFVLIVQVEGSPQPEVFPVSDTGQPHEPCWGHSLPQFEVFTKLL
jgi:hypothetical protein